MRSCGIHEDETEKALSPLLLQIKNGEITSWSQLCITAAVIGIMDECCVLKWLIKYYQMENAYGILFDEMTNGRLMDEHIDGSVIHMLVKRDGLYLLSNIDEFEFNKFDGMTMLKKLDLRNPMKMLNYCLRFPLSLTDKNVETVFDLILKRTIIRSEKVNGYKHYLKMLIKRKEDLQNLMKYEN